MGHIDVTSSRQIRQDSCQGQATGWLDQRAMYQPNPCSFLCGIPPGQDPTPRLRSYSSHYLLR